MYDIKQVTRNDIFEAYIYFIQTQSVTMCYIINFFTHLHRRIDFSIVNGQPFLIIQKQTSNAIVKTFFSKNFLRDFCNVERGNIVPKAISD